MRGDEAPESGIEVEVEGNHLVNRSGTAPRAGWKEAFRAMAQAGDDKIDDGSVASRWDEEEWEW